MSDTEIFYPKGKDIVIAEKKFNIQPFVVKNRIKFVRIIADVMTTVAKVANVSSINASNATSIIPILFDVAADRLPEIYEIVLNKDREWIENSVTIEGEVDIIKAIIEVNNIPLIWGQIQGLMKQKS